MPITLEEAYSVLGVEVGANEDEVRRCYKKLALRTHPDKNPGDEHAHKKFLQISEAYKRITDPESFHDDEEGEPSEEEMEAMFNMMFAEMMGLGGQGSEFGGIPINMFDMLDAMMMDEMGGDEEEYHAYFGGPGNHYYFEDGDEDEDDEERYYYDDDNEDEDGDYPEHLFMQGGGMVEAMLMDALLQEQLGIRDRRGKGVEQSRLPGTGKSKSTEKKTKTGKTKKPEQKAQKKTASISPNSMNTSNTSSSKLSSSTKDRKNSPSKRPLSDERVVTESHDEENWETDDSNDRQYKKKKQSSGKQHSRMVDVDDDENWEDEYGDVEDMIMGMDEEDLMYLMMSGMAGGGGGGGRGVGMDMLEMLAGGMNFPGAMGKNQKSSSKQSAKANKGSAQSFNMNDDFGVPSMAKSAKKRSKGKTKKLSSDPSSKSESSPFENEHYDDKDDNDDDEAEPAIRFSGRGANSSIRPSSDQKINSVNTTQSPISLQIGDNVLVFGR